MIDEKEHYKDYDLVTGTDDGRSFDGMRLWTKVVSGTGREVFTEGTDVSGTALSILSVRQPSPLRALLAETHARAKARLDLKRFEIGGLYVKSISSCDLEKPKPNVADSEIRQAVLESLSNFRRAHPEGYRWMKLEVDGLLSLLEIEKNAYVFNAVFLKEKGWVSEWKADQATLEEGQIYITAEGLEALERMVEKEPGC